MQDSEIISDEMISPIEALVITNFVRASYAKNDRTVPAQLDLSFVFKSFSPKDADLAGVLRDYLSALFEDANIPVWGGMNCNVYAPANAHLEITFAAPVLYEPEIQEFLQIRRYDWDQQRSPRATRAARREIGFGTYVPQPSG